MSGMTLTNITCHVDEDGVHVEIRDAGVELILRPLAKTPSLPPASAIDTEGVALAEVIPLRRVG